jgi:acyl-CoA thioesterase
MLAAAVALPSGAVPSLFERTVALSSLGPGRYAGRVEPAWSGPVAPNGGVLAATMLRAAQAELGDGAPPPRTVAAHFLDAPAAGETELAVEVLRRGKRVSMVDVRLRQAGRMMCQATIVCSAARPGAAELARAAPPAPPPAAVALARPRAVPGAPRVFEQLDLRPVFGALALGAVEAGADAGDVAEAGGWIALRDDPAPLDPARLCALCDLWWPAVFSVLARPAAVPTLELTVHLRRVARPVTGPVLARFLTRTVAEGHIEETGELWSADGDLLAESTQLALLPA